MKGKLTSLPNKRLKRLLILQLLSLVLICLLGGWWGQVILKQARQLAFLQQDNQVMESAHRMIFWEGGTFFVILFAIMGLLYWIYWRDLKRSRSVQAFFASLTHELRTPLTSIRLQAESIAESAEPDSSQNKLLVRLLEDTFRLETQVERTLELARVEGGGSVFNQALPLKPWIERFLQFWSADSKLTVQNKVEDVEVFGDAPSVQVILRNLLENSVKHNKQVEIAVTLRSQNIVKNGQHWTVLVYQDNGTGSKSDGAKLGRLFYRGPESQGAGVGLYLVQALMQRMGGSAQFEVGEGFKASLWFKSHD